MKFQFPHTGPFFRSTVTDDLYSRSYAFANFEVRLQNGAVAYAQALTIPTFLALYIFGFAYELLLAYDALSMKNTIQVIGLCICNLGLLIYGAVQAQQIKSAIKFLNEQNDINKGAWRTTEPALIVIPIVVAIGTAMMAFTAWKLYHEFSWSIYKHISADLQQKRRYLAYQVRTKRPTHSPVCCEQN